MAVRKLPRARLTGLGAGVLGTVLMLISGAFDQLLLGGSPALYGWLFMLVSAVCAGWVRAADLVVAPIAMPMAFAAGLVFTGHPMGVVTGLVLRAGWLYAGTLLAVVIMLVRKRWTRTGTRPDRARRYRKR